MVEERTEVSHMIGYPVLDVGSHWLEEELATYVEPIARAQAGQLSAEKVWESMISGMPQGEPASGDHGLDHTHTWDRTYWGGAMFCLVADVRIRQATHNHKGLRNALRAIVAAHATIDTNGRSSESSKWATKQQGQLSCRTSTGSGGTIRPRRLGWTAA